MATVYFTDFLSDVIENIARSAEEKHHSATRSAMHGVGYAIQQTAVKHGLNIKIVYEGIEPKKKSWWGKSKS